MGPMGSAGIAGASILGLGAVLSYYLWRPSSSSASTSKKSPTTTGSKRCMVLFFNEVGGECYTRPDHKLDCAVVDCPVRHLKLLKTLLSRADKCVDVCLYNFSQPDLEDVLVKLINDGKKVRVVVGDRREGERDFVIRLRKAGAFVTVKDNRPPTALPFKCSELLMHHKFVIIDNKILITGSMNWTRKSFNFHHDHMIISIDSFLVKQFVNEFEYLFSTASTDEKSCVIRPNGDEPFQVVFFRRNNIQCRPDANRKKKCERDDCIFPVYKSILHKILTATVSIDICVQQITVEDLSNELIFAHENGIKIRVITDTEFHLQTGGQVSCFLAHGIPVRMPSNYGSLHHKFLIVDGKILLSGSLNWTMQSFFGNYENILVVSDQDTVSKFQNEFNQLWDRFPADSKVSKENVLVGN